MLMLTRSIWHTTVTTPFKPVNSCLQPDLIYYWSHSESPAVSCQVPGKLPPVSWPPTQDSSSPPRNGAKYTEAGEPELIFGAVYIFQIGTGVAVELTELTLKVKDFGGVKQVKGVRVAGHCHRSIYQSQVPSLKLWVILKASVIWVGSQLQLRLRTLQVCLFNFTNNPAIHQSIYSSFLPPLSTLVAFRAQFLSNQS